jgi:hypothetical protein
LGAFSERVRELALRWAGWARAPGLATRADGPAGAALGGCATGLWFERRSSVKCESVAARVPRVSAAMASIVAKPIMTVRIPRRAIKRLDLLAAL